jgi:hypothetical protein
MAPASLPHAVIPAQAFVLRSEGSPGSIQTCHALNGQGQTKASPTMREGCCGETPIATPIAIIAANIATIAGRNAANAASNAAAPKWNADSK